MYSVQSPSAAEVEVLNPGLLLSSALGPFLSCIGLLRGLHDDLFLHDVGIESPSFSPCKGYARQTVLAKKEHQRLVLGTEPGARGAEQEVPGVFALARCREEDVGMLRFHTRLKDLGTQVDFTLEGPFPLCIAKMESLR